MKFVLVVALALLLICMAQALNCPRICPADIDPVCATNGDCVKEFGNQCMLNAFICEGYRDFYEVPLEECDTGRRCFNTYSD